MVIFHSYVKLPEGISGIPEDPRPMVFVFPPGWWRWMAKPSPGMATWRFGRPRWWSWQMGWVWPESPIGSNGAQCHIAIFRFQSRIFRFQTSAGFLSILLVTFRLPGPSFLGGAPMNFATRNSWGELGGTAGQHALRLFGTGDDEGTPGGAKWGDEVMVGWHGLLGWERMLYIYIYNILHGSMICNCYVYRYIYDTCIYIYI